MFHNVVIGSPIVEPKTLIALDDIDWETNEKEKNIIYGHKISSGNYERSRNSEINRRS